MTTLEGIDVFACVVRCGSFSQAARRLGISKSAVSKMIARLEERLGVQLLLRTTRRIEITEAGAAFYQGCERIVGEAERAARAAQRASAELAGRLRVSLPAPLEALHLAARIPGFLRQHAGIELETVRARRCDAPIESEVDVGIRIGGTPGPACDIRPVAMNSIVVCGAPEYFRRAGAPREPADLIDHECLQYTELFPSGEWELHAPDGRRVAVPVRPVFASESGEAVRAALCAGIGIGFVPTFLVGEDLVAGRLCSVLVDATDAARPIRAVFPHARAQTPLVHAFVESLREHFQPRPDWEPPSLAATTWRGT